MADTFGILGFIFSSIAKSNLPKDDAPKKDMGGDTDIDNNIILKPVLMQPEEE